MCDPQLEIIMATTTQDTLIDAITTANAVNFKKLVLDSTGQTVVEFMSYGCSYCREIEPLIQQVARAQEPYTKFVRVNVEMDAELEQDFRISGTPTFVMFFNGVEVGRDEGPNPTLANLTAIVTEPFIQ